MRSVSKIRTFLLLALLTIPMVVAADAMQSTSYRIKFDSLNAGGGFATSSNFGIQDTVGEQATGDSAGTLYNVRAGYQQVDTPAYITISLNPDVNLPSISGFSGGSSSTTTDWTVITNNSAGYEFLVRATSTPALKANTGAFFSDYVPAGSNPDFTFTYGTTESRFGFSVEGTEAGPQFKDNGSVCGVGTSETTDACYVGFTMTDETVAGRSTANAPGGSVVTLRLKAGIGVDKIQDSGTYSASIVVTAVAL
jgi:hypothetical protein